MDELNINNNSKTTQQNDTNIQIQIENDIYNGIYNEGATCYMNSILQTLFSISPFKRAIFQIPTENDEYNSDDSVALSLQRLFYDLIANRSPASTKNLINSFGWSRAQIETQHDVQEFNMLLSEVIEKKMKGTKVEGTFNNLFQGSYWSIIECTDIDFVSKHEEYFNDIQLNIKNFKNIYESFDNYIKDEVLDNENKYDTEKFGKQKAIKKIRFKKFPPVLFLQLKRIEFNANKKIKINDYFEYYNEINLNKYIDESLTDIDPLDNIYTLQSVVVHQGNANYGHYIAYINNSKDVNHKEWYSYNDDKVCTATEKEIFKESFGDIKYENGKKTKDSLDRNAYLLVYVRKKDQYNLVGYDGLDIVPQEMKKRFENDKEEEKYLQYKELRNNENVNLILISNQNCMNHNNKLGLINTFLDLNNDAPLIYNFNSRILISFPKCLNFYNLIEYISHKTNIPKNEIILFEVQFSDDYKILNRQDYNLKPIENYFNSFGEYKRNKQYFITIFIYIKNNYNLLTNYTNNKDYYEEININEKQFGIVIISKDFNKFIFKNNNTNLTPKNLIISDKMDIDFDKEIIKETKIIFIKKFENEKNSKNLIMEKIIDINLREENIYNKIISNLHSIPFTIIIERTSPLSNNVKNSNSPFFLDSNNIYSILSSVSSLIIIPIYNENLIEETFNYLITLNNTIYLDVYTPQYNGTFNYKDLFKVIKKMKIELKNNQDEKFLKELILKQLKNTKLLIKFFDCKNYYFINKNKEMEILNEENLKRILSFEYLEIYDEIQQRQNNEMREFPILQFINLYECSIKIKINLYKNSDLNNFSFQNIYYDDEYYNEISLISCLIPKNLHTCNEILNYLYEILITKFGSSYQKENYYFILINKYHKFAYQILCRKDIDLKVFEIKSKDIEYHLKPFLNKEIEKFNNPEYKRVYISINNNNYLPLICHFKLTDTFKSIKSEIYNILIKNKHINNKDKFDFHIYRAAILEGNIAVNKRDLIKPDDTLEFVFKDNNNAYNLYIEFSF